ncbi:hypothetical protein BDD12DRAFT_805549 [Trichophaea hybrida]|nr:hypothetical protein BDD12DRAFT_805549 [Trichophaea hybrida]
MNVELETPKIFQLPPELLDAIFSYLDIIWLINMLLTCKGVGDYVWRHLDIRVRQMDFSQARLFIARLIIQSGRNIGPRRNWPSILTVFLDMPHIAGLLREEQHQRRIRFYNFDSNKAQEGSPSSRWFQWSFFVDRWHCFDSDIQDLRKLPQYCEDLNPTEVVELLNHLDNPFAGLSWSAIRNQDCQILRVLARHGWVNMPLSIHHAVNIALFSPTALAMRVLQIVLSITVPRRCVPMILHAVSPDALFYCGLENSEASAAILTLLFDTLHQYGENYFSYSVRRLRDSFMLALMQAVEKQDYGETPRLLVLETWLRAHELILVGQNVRSWRRAIDLRDARLLRDILCIYMDGEVKLKVDVKNPISEEDVDDLAVEGD